MLREREREKERKRKREREIWQLLNHLTIKLTDKRYLTVIIALVIITNVLINILKLFWNIINRTILD